MKRGTVFELLPFVVLSSCDYFPTAGPAPGIVFRISFSDRRCLPRNDVESIFHRPDFVLKSPSYAVGGL